MIQEIGSTVTVSGRSRSGTDYSLRSTLTQPSTVSVPEFWPHSIFLQTPACQHMPHTLHTAQILPGITLVIVSQVSKSAEMKSIDKWDCCCFLLYLFKVKSVLCNHCIQRKPGSYYSLFHNKLFLLCIKRTWK